MGEDESDLGDFVRSGDTSDIHSEHNIASAPQTDQLIQALFLYRTHPALGERVQVG